MFDTVLRNGQVWDGTALVSGSLAVHEGRVAQLLPPGAEVVAKAIIDVKDKWLLPGFLDTHFHSRAPGHTEREDFDTGTLAALAGGVTTVLEMPFAIPSVHSAASFESRLKYASERAHCDFAFWGVGAVNDPTVLEGLANLGAVGFKILLHPPPHGREDEFALASVRTAPELLSAIEQIARTGRPAAVHCEDGDLVHMLTERQLRHRPMSADAHLRSRPAFVEAIAVAKVLELAQFVGARLHLPHISSARALSYIRLAKAEGQPVTVETCPHYLLFDETAYDRVGPYAKINPPIRSRVDRLALVQALQDGTVDIVGSDHAPYTVPEKERGWGTIFDAPSGCPGIEMMAPSVLDMAIKQELPLTRAIQALSSAPAAAFDLRTKGTLKVGADADVVVFDPEQSWTVDLAQLHTRSAGSARLYDRMTFQGKIESVLLRGQTAMLDGRSQLPSGTGRLVRPGSPIPPS